MALSSEFQGPPLIWKPNFMGVVQRWTNITEYIIVRHWQKIKNCYACGHEKCLAEQKCGVDISS